MIRLKKCFRCFIRLNRLLLQFSLGLFESALLRIKYGAQWYHTETGSEAIQTWMKKTCTITGLNIIKSGELLHPSASLIVANHVSWLDIIALSSIIKSSFISKNEIKKWPVIGTLADNSGTIFINRNTRTDLYLAINSITNIINQGKSVILFPEGTTTNGNSVIRFKSTFFQSAINSNCPIQPITIRYIRNSKRDKLAPYIDDDNFILHLLHILCQTETTVRLYINKKIFTKNNNRQELTHKSYKRIKHSLTLNL